MLNKLAGSILRPHISLGAPCIAYASPQPIGPQRSWPYRPARHTRHIALAAMPRGQRLVQSCQQRTTTPTNNVSKWRHKTWLNSSAVTPVYHALAAQQFWIPSTHKKSVRTTKLIQLRCKPTSFQSRPNQNRFDHLWRPRDHDVGSDLWQSP